MRMAVRSPVRAASNKVFASVSSVMGGYLSLAAPCGSLLSKDSDFSSAFINAGRREWRLPCLSLASASRSAFRSESTARANTASYWANGQRPVYSVSVGYLQRQPCRQCPFLSFLFARIRLVSNVLLEDVLCPCFLSLYSISHPRSPVSRLRSPIPGLRSSNFSLPSPVSRLPLTHPASYPRD